MNESRNIMIKLLIAVLVPLLIVTLGGLIIYQTFAAFFFPATETGIAESNGPALIYYSLTFVIAVMFFLLRQGYKGFEFIALGLMALVYSISMQKMTPVVHRPIYIYFLPLLAFFIMLRFILKYIFLNKSFRSARLLLFSLLSAAAFTITFWLQYVLLRQMTEANFLQARFISGLMLFIFLGFGLSLAEFFIIKIEGRLAVKDIDLVKSERQDIEKTEDEKD